jgi:hypothetical protein
MEIHGGGVGNVILIPSRDFAGHYIGIAEILTFPAKLERHQDEETGL